MPKNTGVRIFPPDMQFMGPNEGDIPARRSGVATKWRARMKPLWGIFVRGLFSPIVNAGAFFGLVTIPFLLFFLSAFLGEKGLTTRIDTLGATTLATIGALPLWALINLIMAPMKALSAEKDLGAWQGFRFIYREPQLVLTAEWRPSDNGNFVPIPLKIDGGLLIDYRIDVDGPQDRINSLVLGAYFFRPLEDVLRTTRFNLRGRVVVKKDGCVGLHCYSLPDTLPALVRVYVLAFENDPSIRMDYTDERTQTRFVLAPPDETHSGNTTGTNAVPPETGVGQKTEISL
jgi:hypothetical protein